MKKKRRKPLNYGLIVNSQPTARAASKSKSDPEVMFYHHGQRYCSFLCQEIEHTAHDAFSLLISPIIFL